MSHKRLEGLAQAIASRQERYQRRTPLFDQVVQLLAQARPVAPDQLASALQRPLDETLAILRQHPELEYNAHGDIVGSGLTLNPTPHRFQVKQRTLFAWCAMDILTYPVSLALTVQVTSHCPMTGRTIRLTVTPQRVLDLHPPSSRRGDLAEHARSVRLLWERARGRLPARPPLRLAQGGHAVAGDAPTRRDPLRRGGVSGGEVGRGLSRASSGAWERAD
jgi:Alkylmercury lyase/Helix-turn-helix domain of alkylmercury lyase